MKLQSLAIVTIFFLFGSCCLLSCSNTSTTAQQEEPARFLYLAHTRLNDNSGIYDKIYDIDLNDYQMLLLGGDLAANSFADTAIIQHLDSVFDLKAKTTLWSIGNHDKTSDARFLKTTNKNKTHSYSAHDVTFITLDSQDSLSSIVGAQKEFLMRTLDTLSTSSVLLMTHKLIFMNGHPTMDAKIETVCNGRRGDCYHCHNPNNFQTDIVPALEALVQQGKQVIVVGGDLGYQRSSYEHKDANGITYLGNGVWFPKDGNTVLEFSKSPQSPLQYQFKAIDSVLKVSDAKKD